MQDNVDHYDILTCAVWVSLKSLEGLVVRFYFLVLNNMVSSFVNYPFNKKKLYVCVTV